MLTRLTILLTEEERTTLQALAEGEMRGLREQIRYLLREEVRKRTQLHADDSQVARDKQRPEHI